MSPANPDTVNSKKNTLRGMRLMSGSWDPGWSRALALYGAGVAGLDRAAKAWKILPSERADEILCVVRSLRGDGGAHRLRDRANDPRRPGRGRAPAKHVVLDLSFTDRPERRGGIRQSHFRGREEKPGQP